MNTKENFFGLLCSRNILIPTIQRDYVQGRIGGNAESVRKGLITDFIEMLEGKKKIDFNYIYGIEKEGEVFLPIDGQQRLTSTFLLAWFLAVKDGETKAFCETVKQFSYQVRSTAEQFFDVIQLKQDGDLKYLADFKTYVCESGSKLHHFPWFKRRWLSDQTVRSAIVFLDALKERVSKGPYYRVLMNENCPVEFICICQNDVTMLSNKSEREKEEEAFEAENRAAVTYINMNARGKVLNGFENLKALLNTCREEGNTFVKRYDNEYIHSFSELISSEAKKMSLSERVNRMDDMMLHFLINVYADLSELFKADKNASVKSLQNVYEFMDEIKQEEHVFPQFYFDFVRYVLDLYDTYDGKEKEILKNYCGSKVTGPQKWKFYGWVWPKYRLRQSAVLSEHWKIFERNLCIGSGGWENGFVKGFRVLEKVIAKILESGKGLPEFLSGIDTPERFIEDVEGKGLITDAAIHEERIKAQLYLEDSSRKDLMEEVGNRRKNKLRYLLYLSGYYHSQGEWESFCRYAKYDGVIGEKNKPDLLWEKAFYLEQCGETMQPPESPVLFIRDSVFYWDDDKRLPEFELNLLRNIYDKLEQKNMDIEAYIVDVKQKVLCNSWLYYILNRNYFELLSWKVMKQGSEYVVEKSNYFERVLMLDLRTKNVSEVREIPFFNNIYREVIAPREGDEFTNNRTVSVNVRVDIPVCLSEKVVRMNDCLYKVAFDSYSEQAPYEDLFRWSCDESFITQRRSEFSCTLRLLEASVTGLLTEDNLYEWIFKGSDMGNLRACVQEISSQFKMGWGYLSVERLRNDITIYLKCNLKPFEVGETDKKVHSAVLNFFEKDSWD